MSHGSGSLPSSGSHQVGESAPSEPNSASVPVPPENELAAPAPETVLAAVSVVLCVMRLTFSRRLSAIHYGVAAVRGASARENAGNGRSAQPFSAAVS